MKKRVESMSDMVMLSDKRLLSVPEFCAYTSTGRNKAMEMAALAGAISRMGKRVLIDRVKFDVYCDQNEVLL